MIERVRKIFLLDEFEDGWGMDDEFICEEQLFDYCVEVLFIPDEKIDELNMRNDELEIVLKDLELEDMHEDWYVNLLKKFQRKLRKKKNHLIDSSLKK